MPNGEEKLLNMKRQALITKVQVAKQEKTESKRRLLIEKVNMAKDANVSPFVQGYREFKAAGEAINQSTLFGMQDELAGGIDAMIASIKGEKGSFKDIYVKYRDIERLRLKKIAEQGAVGDIVGTVAGALVNPMGTGKITGLKTAATTGAKLAGLGAGAAAGYSEADLTEGQLPQLASEASMGALMSAGLPLLGGGLVKTAKAIPKLAKKSFSVLTGVNEDVAAKYIARADEINSAPTREAIMDEMDEGVAALKNVHDDAKFEMRAAKSDLDQAYKNAKRDLEQAQPDAALAKELQDAYGESKSILGSLSEQADDALARIPGKVSKNGILKYIDKVINAESKGVGAIGEKRISAISKLNALKKRVDDGLDDWISHPDLREVMRQVREDINWNQINTEFNESANRMRKAVTEGVSDLLKGKSQGIRPKQVTLPEHQEYEAIMARMQGHARSLQDMGKEFGTEEAASRTIKKFFAPKAGDKFARERLSKFSEMTGNDYMGRLEGYKQTKGLIERAKRGNIHAELVPGQVAVLEQAETNFIKARMAYDRVSKLGPNRTQQLIKQQGQKNARIKDRRALEALEEATGKPFVQMIEDRNIADLFKTRFLQGSRNVRLWSGLGGGAYGAMNWLVDGDGSFGQFAMLSAGGAFLGALVDFYGPRGGKRILDRYIKSKAAGKRIDPGVLKQMGVALKESFKQGNPRAAAVHYYLSERESGYLEQFEKNMEKSGITPPKTDTLTLPLEK